VKCGILALPTNIRLGWKGMPGTKHSSLLQTFVNYDLKSLISLGRGKKVLLHTNSLAYRRRKCFMTFPPASEVDMSRLAAFAEGAVCVPA
jgi:hypothetical protein